MAVDVRVGWPCGVVGHGGSVEIAGDGMWCRRCTWPPEPEVLWEGVVPAAYAVEPYEVSVAPGSVLIVPNCILPNWPTPGDTLRLVRVRRADKPSGTTEEGT